MTTIRPFSVDDLFDFNQINLDPLTETYNLTFYLHYLAKWPDMFQTCVSRHGDLQGYIMGKAEGQGREWHGHVTALSVEPGSRRIGLAQTLMTGLETSSDQIYNGYFVDLFVRDSNVLAKHMYEKFGYKTYRRVLNYYSEGPAEDALDMRKALSRDPEKHSMIPLKHPVKVEDLY